MLPFIGPIWSSKLGPFAREAREHEAAVFADARRAREPESRLVETLAAAFRHRHVQRACRRCRSSSRGSSRSAAAGVALALVHHLGAAVGAAVEQHLHAAVASGGT